jgi:D-cysteine desulfhydrase family pyridoxal phosphate-dependent enzyme
MLGRPMSRAFEQLEKMPRVRLGHAPTPLEAMVNLGQSHGDRPMYVKRDDCTGLAFGGNKVRQLEFYLGEAVAAGADTVLISGAVQSNFTRLTAAACATLGLQCHIQLEQRVPKIDPTYNASGNVILDRLLGATLHFYAYGEDEEGADRRLHEIADQLSAHARTPYVIHLAPGHRPLGALGYLVVARELLDQITRDSLVIDEIVVASGSGNTHAGLLFGLRALGSRIPITGVCVRRGEKDQFDRIKARLQQIADLLNVDPVADDDDIRLTDAVLAPGYGQLNESTLAAIKTAAQLEGLILDPVYTGKSMAGFLQRAEVIEPGRSLLFIHTGGQPALFAYEKDLSAALD